MDIPTATEGIVAAADLRILCIHASSEIIQTFVN